MRYQIKDRFNRRSIRKTALGFTGQKSRRGDIEPVEAMIKTTMAGRVGSALFTSEVLVRCRIKQICRAGAERAQLCDG